MRINKEAYTHKTIYLDMLLFVQNLILHAKRGIMLENTKKIN